MSFDTDGPIFTFRQLGIAAIQSQVNDTLAKTERSTRMSLIRGRDTKPEMIVRRLAHAMGFRFRLHRRDLPGSPDLVFPRWRKIIFVHGCFWHRHPDPACKLARLPKSRLEFWLPKLEANRRRDLDAETKLRADGWRTKVVWECQLRDREQLGNEIREFLIEGNGG